MPIAFNQSHHGADGRPGHAPHPGHHAGPIPPPHPILGGFGADGRPGHAPHPIPGGPVLGGHRPILTPPRLVHQGGPIFTPPRAHTHPPAEGIHPLGPGRNAGGYDSMSSTTAKVSAEGKVS